MRRAAYLRRCPRRQDRLIVAGGPADTVGMDRPKLPDSVTRSLPRWVRVYQCDWYEAIVRYWPSGHVVRSVAVEPYLPGSAAWGESLWRAVDELMKKPTKGETSRPGAPAAAPGSLRLRHPGLSEHLTATAYEDGTPRQTSTVLIFAAEGVWKATLRDREEGRCLWVAADSFDELWTVLEASVNDPAAVWRDDRLSGADTAKRRKS